MFPLLLALVLPPQPAIAAAPMSTPSSLQADPIKEEYKKRRADAGKDVALLWMLVDWCETNRLDTERKSCLAAILKLDDKDARAHKLLGHVEYEGQWFDSEKKLEAHKKKLEKDREKEAEKKAKELGWVRFDDRWVDPEDVPFLEKGWVKNELGEWLDPADVERLQQGWTRQDLEWVRPEEKAKADQGLWKCGEDWLSLADANAYHAELDRWWRIPGEHFDLYTTLSRENALKAQMQIEDTARDLERLFGIVPPTKPHVALLNSTDQYSLFAKGSEGARVPTDLRGFSSVHGAFFAELWVDVAAKRYLGAGVGYWNEKGPNGESFGKLFARHAAGQSFVEGLDPSRDVLAEWLGKEPLGQFPLEAFWEAKLIPAWLRYGAASYVERYYVDSFVAAGGDPNWARKWSVGNLQRRGGLGALERIFELPLNVDDPESSEKLISEAGLLVAFILDGGCAPVLEELAKVQEALRAAKRDPKTRKDFEKAIAGLQGQLVKNEPALKEFAGL